MDKSISIEKSRIKGRVDSNDSKSYLHRLLFLAFIQKDLKKVCIRINEQDLSKDIEATIGVLNKIGADIKTVDNYIEVRKSAIPSRDEVLKLNVMESGSTLRFVLPILAFLGLSVEIYGEGRALLRPLKDLTKLLTEHGYEVVHKEKCLVGKGKLKPSVYNIRGYVSSQFITGLAFALALMDGGKINIEGTIVSRPYLELTCQVMEKFGFEIKLDSEGLEVAKKGKLTLADNCFGVEGDWSSAAALLTIGIFSEKIEVGNIPRKSAQADSRIVDILKRAGGKIDKTGAGYQTARSSLQPMNIDVNQCPDLAPNLAVLAAFTSGMSTITGIRRLQDKESDRLQEITHMLDSIGRRYELYDDELRIFGKDKDISVDLAYEGSDHRLAMAYTAISQRNVKKTTIEHPQCVDKSFVNFFGLLETIGMKICN